MATSGDAWIEQWLSRERFALYLRKAGGDRTRALALYEWNAKLSAAFLHDLNHLEVALRNATTYGSSMPWQPVIRRPRGRSSPS